MTHTSISTTSEEFKESKKVTEFSYLLQRKCLRMMRRYFKQRFQDWGLFRNYKKEIRFLSLDQLNEKIREFIILEFPYLQRFPEYIDYIKLEKSLKIIILCDRYNKGEPIISGLDFTVLRNVLNKFNSRNLINFFSSDSYAFLFNHYVENHSQIDAAQQTDVEPEKLKEELDTLYDEAFKYSKQQNDFFFEYKRKQEIEPPVDYNNECLFDM